MQQSANKILSEKKNFYFNRGIEFVLKDPLPKDINIEKVMGLLRANLPVSSYDGIKNVYFGKFKILDKRQLTALHHKDNIYIDSAEATSEKEILDDLVHEFAHRFEENNTEAIYEDGKIVNEFIGKRNDAGVTFSDNTLSGRAMFVFDANDATHLLLADEKGQIFVVDTKSKNIEIAKLTTVDKTRKYSEVICKNLEAELLKNSSDSEEPIKQAIDAGRIMLAADSLGASQIMIDKAVDYAKERKQFGRAIGSFQAVKHMCAEMASDLEPCYALIWHAAHCHDHAPLEARLMACHAKAHVSEMSKGIAKKATEVHGGMGFTDLLGLHYWFKRIGVNRQILGSPEILREEAIQLQIL